MMKRVFSALLLHLQWIRGFLAGFPDKEQATQKQNQITGGIS